MAIAKGARYSGDRFYDLNGAPDGSVQEPLILG
jgi:hypothetical protein